MSLQCGIVGLPNVGKSTLFNALGSAKAEAANYPFCTIEPNVGIVNVPDPILEEIAKIVKAAKIVPATTQIVDIAGIVKGASKGEGLGNKFLTHIRQTDAILQLVRCFANDDIIHVDGSVDPMRDIEVVSTELILADIESLDKKLEKDARLAKSGDPEARKNIDFWTRLKAHLNEGRSARSMPMDAGDGERLKPLFLLTAKPVLYVANSTGKPEEKAWVDAVEMHARKENASFLVLDCALESEIASLPDSEKGEFLSAMGLEEPGLNRMIRSVYSLLNLMSYYTAGVKEARAWTIPKGTKAPQAAGVIHTDFERGFICAECYKASDLIEHRSEAKLRELGLLRTEGKEYTVQPDDVLLFRFNV